MKVDRNAVVIWAPRIAGMALAASLAVFAADVFLEDRGIVGTLVGLIV